jgi:hypothetical protein
MARFLTASINHAQAPPFSHRGHCQRSRPVLHHLPVRRRHRRKATPTTRSRGAFSTGRYQQVHGDLRGNVRTITALSLRRDTGIGAFASSTARTIDAEFFMADSDFANGVFDVREQLRGRGDERRDAQDDQPARLDRRVSRGARSLQLQRAARHAVRAHRVKDLVWEVLLYSNTATGTYITDAPNRCCRPLEPNVSTGSTTGCLATGRTSRMSLTRRSRPIGWRRR